MNTDVMFSSKTDKHDTPQHVIDDLAKVFEWDIDVCASRPNVCEMFYAEANNGLEASWYGLCWMNPPYGREIEKWMIKARVLGANVFLNGETINKGLYKPVKAVVCLVPARTDTKWWQSNVPHASQVVFIWGRLKFGNAANSAPFPSAFVVFGEINQEQRNKLASYGWSIDL